MEYKIAREPDWKNPRGWELQRQNELVPGWIIVEQSLERGGCVILGEKHGLRVEGWLEAPNGTLYQKTP